VAKAKLALGVNAGGHLVSAHLWAKCPDRMPVSSQGVGKGMNKIARAPSWTIPGP